ncbi:unnamed protein product [Rhodiola kirilowii]
MSYQMRSVSFPARSQHPIILRIETELNKLLSWQHDHSISASSTMAEAVFFSLSRLEELHDCMDEILALPSTRHALSANVQHSFLDSLLDASLKLLDACSASRDAVLGIKEHVQDLQTTMRRRRAGVDTIVANYISSRKRMRKVAKRNISLLKQLEQDIDSSLPENPDQQLLSLIRAVKDVILTNASIFESMLMFVSAQEHKTKGVGKLSRFMTKGVVSAADNNNCANELAQLDAELWRFGKGAYREGSSTLQTVNIIVDGMESSLERVFRCLIKTRASFLNIRSY